jgi:hypothetical protein
MSEHETQQKISALRKTLEQKANKFDRPVFGWTPPTVERKEGEEWVDDDGKEWTKKNGLIQSVSKLSMFKRPWFCPQCSKSMSHRFDDKFYNRTGKCYNCNIEDDTKLVLNGTFEAVHTKRIRANEISWLKDHIMECKDYIRTFKVPQVHFENGGWEEIAKVEHFSQLFDTINQEIETCSQRLKFLEEERKLEAEQERESITKLSREVTDESVK